MNDNQLDVTLNVDFGDATYEDIRAQVDEWKNQLPITDSKQQKRESREMAEVAPKAKRMSDVVSKLLSFPFAYRSPMDAWEFLYKLQQEAASLF